MTEHTYDWWQRAQAGAEVGGPECPVHDGVAHLGFYRMRAAPPKGQKYRDQPWVPVAIFVHNGELIATVGEDQPDPARIWNHCAENHVSEAAYRKALEIGKWDDIDEAVQVKAAPTVMAPPPMGHNAPPDEVAAFMDQIETVAASLVDYQSIDSDDQAARAQSLRSRLLELHREADKKREAEKKPHFQAAKAVDERWRGVIAFAKNSADHLATALSAFFTTKARAAQEEERKAQAASDKAAAKGKPAAAAPWSAPAPQPTQVKGGYGGASAVKVVKVVIAITDWDALWNFMRGHAEVKDLLTKLAQRAVDKGHTVPGVSIEEQRRVA